jgi:copper homeostasis protein CutC
MFCLSCSACPVLPVLFWVSCPRCPVLAVSPGRIYTHEQEITSAKIKKHKYLSVKNQEAQKIKELGSTKVRAQKLEILGQKKSAKSFHQERASSKPKEKHVPNSGY